MPDQQPIWEQQAALLRNDRIVRLAYSGAMPVEVRAALADAPKLAEVVLNRASEEDLAAVAALPALRRLTLAECRIRAARGLALLRSATGLEALRLEYMDWTAAAVAEVLPNALFTTNWRF